MNPVQPPEPPFALTAEEKHSALWQKLEAHFRERLAKKRRSNDVETNDEAATAALRGRIAELKYLIGLGGNPLD